MPLSQSIDYIMQALSCCEFNGQQHSVVPLREADQGATLQNVNLNIGSGNWISFSPDDGRGDIKKMSPLFSTTSGEGYNRACDCVIVKETTKKEIKIIYIDLKSKSPTHFSGQFKSVRQFMRYLLNLIQEFKGENYDISDERFVIIHSNTASIRKRGTAKKANPQQPISPDNPMRISSRNGGEVYLNEIYSGA